MSIIPSSIIASKIKYFQNIYMLVLYYVHIKYVPLRLLLQKYTYFHYIRRYRKL